MELKHYIIVGALLVGTALYNNSGSVEKECLTHQGYRVSQGSYLAIFDDKPFSERVGPAELVVEGTSLDDVTLEIGSKYLVEYKKGKLMGLPRLLSTSECD
jgi:hypothetical protein